MPRELYNEGRVCGISAYESYVKNALEEDPNTEPVSEREWLASTLAMGSSMLLRVSASTELVRDFKLPSDSTLVAPSTITASYFMADPSNFNGLYDSTGWLKQVGSYGDLLTNDSSNPKSGAVYPHDSDSMTSAEKTRLRNYMRIQDGLVLQDGTWETRSASNNPKRILTYPNFKDSPTVRLRFSYEVTQPFLILLTGFVTWGVVIGESGFGGGAADTANPYNGDFLGPAVFPWANKIMFHTSSAMAYQSQTSLQAGSGNVEIDSDPDSFDTTIKVKNEIISKSEPYLVVVQTEDGGHTEITLDTDALLSLIDDHLKSSLIDLVHPGSGINIDSVSNGVNVRTYLEAASGIKIYTGSNSNPGEQTTTHQSTKVAANIQPGAGIAIDTNEDNSITITNTEVGGVYETATGYGCMDDTLSGAPMYSLNNPFVVKWYNHFFAGTDHNGEYTENEPSDWQAFNNGHGAPSVRVCPSYANDGSMSSVSVQITTNSSYNVLTRWGDMTSTTFQFRHSSSIYDVPTSRLFSIMFPYESDWKDISHKSAKQTIETSDYLTGIWNMSSSWSGGGFSWPVRCYIDVEYNTGSQNTNSSFNALEPSSIYGQYRIFTVSAMSIADGVNSQYSGWPYTSASSTVLAGLLNLVVSFSIVFNT